MLFILGTCRTDQNVTFNPSCITRLLPDPTSGLPAAKPRLSLGITSAWIGSKCIANTDRGQIANVQFVHPSRNHVSNCCLFGPGSGSPAMRTGNRATRVPVSSDCPSGDNFTGAAIILLSNGT